MQNACFYGFLKMQNVFRKIIFSIIFFSSLSLPESIVAQENGFTINYTNVSLLEYVKFVGKICKTNFIYDENELANLTITVVSDEPITRENLMSTLIQTLRIHGLNLLEQEGSLLITKSDSVKQLAHVSSSTEELNPEIPIITKVFRVKNTSVESIAAIIQSMISAQAVLDVLPETRQIILTDITTNLEKVESLIENLDSPETPLEIEPYKVRFNQPEYLISLASQLMAPLSQGSPFILVPHDIANTIYIVSTPRLVEKAIAIFSNLDVEPDAKTKGKRVKGENLLIYKAQEKNAMELVKALSNIASTLKESGVLDKDLIETIETQKFIPETNSILFMGSPASLAKVKEFLLSLDAPGKAAFSESTRFFIYKPQFLSISATKKAIDEYAKNLALSKYTDQTLIESLQNAKVIPSTQSILFTGDPVTFEKIREILNSIDNASDSDVKGRQKTFWMYKIEKTTSQGLIDALNSMVKDLKKADVIEQDLIETIDSMKYLKDSNSLLFTGPQSGVQKLQNFLPSFDQVDGLLPISSQFLVHRPVYLTGDQILESLKDLAKNLEDSQLSDPALIRAIDSGKYVKSTQTILFTGDPESLKRLEALLQDVDGKETAQYAKATYWIHPLKYVSRERAEEYLKQVTLNLSKSGLKNEPVVAAIRSMRYVPESRSLMFSGTQDALNQVQEILNSFDSPEVEKQSFSAYFLYKLQNVSGALIEEDLERFADNLKSTGLKDSELIKVLDNAKWVRETNSILLTGDSKAIQEAKEILNKFDVIRDDSKRADLFMYKPKFLPPELLQKSLNELVSNLKKSDLSDSALVNLIKSMRYSDTTQTLIFTGDPSAIKKLQVILQNIDDENAQGPIQQIGKTTFLLYKLKNASGNQIQASIRQILKDLKRSGTSDKNFLKTLESMKYVPETNSLLFTGDPTSLEKAQALVEKFDVKSLAGRVEMGPAGETFFVYKPKYLSGTELQKQLEDFADNLKMTGLSDPLLYQALNNARWVEANKSLIITADPQTLEKVKGLLREVDVVDGIAPHIEPTIQPGEQTSFLVYKLQYHKGESIRAALRSIAKDLSESKVPQNQVLLDAINAVQWIEVTNSLLCTADPQTLARLRELIKSLDIPLKQVFIEVLVIETSLSNSLEFGLDWLGKGKWKDKAATSISNANSTTDAFSTNFQSINATNTPQGTTIPFANSGFSFGAIGDVIFHKGASFVSMGSLMKALQNDRETIIVTTPKVFAQDSKKSTLFIGQNIPFVGSFVTNQGNNVVNTTNIEYRDIGTNLEITPVLGNSDIVTLNLSLSRSSTDTGGGITLNVGNVQGVTTNKTSLDTTFHVPNKHFLILTGLVSQTKDRQKSGLPCLGGLPLIGAAFNLNNNVDSFNNIVIFLRPHILNSLEDLQDITGKQEDYFREETGAPVLESEFDEAMEKIKSYDDE